MIYNCKTTTTGYRITKFDDDLNVESSYETTLAECTCPQGSKPTCRHRQMLPEFLLKGAVDNATFLCWHGDAASVLWIRPRYVEETTNLANLGQRRF